MVRLYTFAIMFLSLIARKFYSDYIHIALLLIFSLVIFYHANGNMPIAGDDIVDLKENYQTSFLVKNYGILFILNHRAFLGCSQNFLYHFLGQSLAKCQIVYFATYILSCLLWYLFLRNVFSKYAAFLGALLFLSYSGKYEIFSAFSAGMYPFVMLIGVSIFICLSLEIKPYTKAILVSLLLWLSLPFYEILIMLLPVFPILFLGRCVLEKRRPTGSDIALSFLPALPVIIHVIILSTNTTTTVWLRDKGDSYFNLPLTEKLWHTFFSSLDKTLGVSHYDLLSHGIWSFFTFVTKHPNGHHGVLLWLIIGFIGSLSAFFIATPSQSEKLDNNRDRSLFLIIGLYLWLFSGLISFILGAVFPSRMTYLPSAGISIIFTYLAHYAIDYRFRSIPKYLYICIQGMALLAILFVCFCEEVTLSSIVRQFETARSFDQAIVDQIKKLQPSIPAGSIVYVNMPMPENALNRFWIEGCSSFESGGAYGILWYTYDSPINGIEYINTKRWPTDKPGLTFDSLLEKMTPEKMDKIYPFYISDNLIVKGIKKINILSADKSISKTLSFPTMEKLDDANIVSLDTAAQ